MAVDLLRFAAGAQVKARVPQSEPCPKLLYKYFSPDRIDAVDALKVRFSQYRALNDPLEFGTTVDDRSIHRLASWLGRIIKTLMYLLILFRLPRELSKAIRADETVQRLRPMVRTLVLPVVYLIFIPRMLIAIEESYPTVIEQLKASLEEYLRVGIFDKSVLIFSCSEDCLSGPMWAHYSANHSGFQVGFDPSAAFKLKDRKGNPEQLVPIKVSYFSTLPVISGRLADLRYLGQSKLDGWSYEREWRFSAQPEQLDQPTESDGHGLPIFLVELSPLAVKEITFGYKAPASVVDAVRLACEHRSLRPTFWKMGSDGQRRPL